MKFAFAFAVLLVNFAFAVYCYSPCSPDTLSNPNTQMFQTQTKQDLMQIKNQIELAKSKLDTLQQLNADKLKSYTAEKNLKEQELIELKKINFLIKQLIEQENIRIKALDIKIKGKIK